MRNTTALLIASICFSPVAVFAPSALAQSPDSGAGKATGQFIIGDTTFPLRFAYANSEDDVENTRSDGPQKSLFLLFSDEAVPAEKRSDWFTLTQRTRAGKMHAVQLRYDPAKKELFGATIFYVTPNGKDSPSNITMSGGDNNYTLENLAIKDGMVSGSASMKGPEQWTTFDEPEGSTPRNYTYSVSFSAPIVNPSPVTANLTGKAAQASPQTALATKFFKATYAGDLAMLRLLSLPNAAFEGFVKKEGVAKAKSVLKQLAPDPAIFTKMPKHVIVRGDTATVIAGTAKSKTGSLILRMVRQNGKWLVSR